jgi:hypothetical protein
MCVICLIAEQQLAVTYAHAVTTGVQYLQKQINLGFTEKEVLAEMRPNLLSLQLVGENTIVVDTYLCTISMYYEAIENNTQPPENQLEYFLSLIFKYANRQSGHTTAG